MNATAPTQRRRECRMGNRKRFQQTKPCKTGKAPFAGQGAALAALERIKKDIAQAAVAPEAPPVRAYHCPLCGQWHLTKSGRESLMTKPQEDAIADLNNRWGVASWKHAPGPVLLATLDDGDIVEIEPNGEWRLRA